MARWMQDRVDAANSILRREMVEMSLSR